MSSSVTKKLYKIDGIGSRLLSAVDLLMFRTNSDFIEKSGLSKQVFYSIIRTNRKPQKKTLKLLEDIGINTEWILYGAGEPLLTQRVQQKPGEKLGELAKPESLDDNLKDAIRNLLELMGPAMKEQHSLTDLDVSKFDKSDVMRILVQILSNLDAKSLRIIHELSGALAPKGEDKPAQESAVSS